jgi:hypothetical protein
MMQTVPQMMPQMQQMPVAPQMMQGGVSPMSRPVSSREEAQATAADFSGAPMVFLDRAHRRVYVKQWNMQTGMADFEDYGPVIEQRPAAPEYVNVHTFQSELDKLRSEIASMKGGVTNAE